MTLNKEQIIGGIIAVVTGDALGLPVQFLSRSEVRQHPVTGMRGGGAFDLPPGTWSDDSSLTLCLVESLTEKGYDLKDMAERFVRWYRDGYMTPFGKSFDIGHATSVAMRRLMKGIDPLEAGPAGEEDNGNGSLMRILPAAIYFGHLSDEELVKKVSDISKITHGHPRSQLGCSLYALLVKALLEGENPEDAYKTMRGKAAKLSWPPELSGELIHYQRLLGGYLHEVSEEVIQATGYVVYTLEAAVWSLLTTKSFEECLLKSVNLGLDTDTVGAVAGGLAGICYGLAAIPREWRLQIIKYEEILAMSQAFADQMPARSGTQCAMPLMGIL